MKPNRIPETPDITERAIRRLSPNNKIPIPRPSESRNEPSRQAVTLFPVALCRMYRANA